MVKSMLNDSFTEASQLVSRIKLSKGLALADIITEVHTYTHRIEFPPTVR